jgi:hypothetical protein
MNYENSHESNELKTEDYFIAYLDILGYEENVIMEDKNNSNTFFNTIKECVKYSEYFVKNSGEIHKNAEIQMKIFTDNFFYCTKKDYLTLLNIISFLQSTFIQKNIFIRGALYHGKLYIDDNFIYGKGVIDAYKIESKIAIFPRIIIDDTFFKGALEIEKIKYPNDVTLEKIQTGLNSHYCIDFDNNKYIDYIGNIKFTLDAIAPETIGINFNTLLSIHANYICENLKTENKRVLQKYQWCKKYHNDICKKYDYGNLRIK